MSTTFIFASLLCYMRKHEKLPWSGYEYAMIKAGVPRSGYEAKYLAQQQDEMTNHFNEKNRNNK